MTLIWHRVYGDRGLQWAECECSIGTFRTRTVGRRVILSLNDVKIGNHGDAARARAQAERPGEFGPSQTPHDWWCIQSTKRLAKALLERLPGITGGSKTFERSDIWTGRRGARGGIFAHPVLACAYAGYLSPELELEVRQVRLRYRAGDPTLADDILSRASPGRPNKKSEHPNQRQCRPFRPWIAAGPKSISMLIVKARAMVKGAETDMSDLQPPRHISTLPTTGRRAVSSADE
jgi:hypothetical protein